jgi:hypothetical protein
MATHRRTGLTRAFAWRVSERVVADTVGPCFCSNPMASDWIGSRDCWSPLMARLVAPWCSVRRLACSLSERPTGAARRCAAHASMALR